MTPPHPLSRPPSPYPLGLKGCCLCYWRCCWRHCCCRAPRSCRRFNISLTRSEKNSPCGLAWTWSWSGWVWFSVYRHSTRWVARSWKHKHIARLIFFLKSKKTIRRVRTSFPLLPTHLVGSQWIHTYKQKVRDILVKNEVIRSYVNIWIYVE